MAALSLSKDCAQSMSNASGISTSSGATSEKLAESAAEPKSGPSDPATVVAAAKSTFQALGDAGGALLLTEESQRAISDSSPMVSSDAVMLEKTLSGTIRVPRLDGLDEHDCRKPNSVRLEASTTHLSTDSSSTANGKECPETPVDPVAKRRNLEWLRMHYRSMNEMARLPYVHADLLQLYGYFYSPPPPYSDDEGSVMVHDGILGPPQHPGGLGYSPVGGGSPMTNPWTPSSSPLKQSALQRKTSYRGLHDIMTGQNINTHPSPNFCAAAENSSKRRPVPDQSVQPATKRARSEQPRIDYFPRLKVSCRAQCVARYFSRDSHYSYKLCTNNTSMENNISRRKLSCISQLPNKPRHWRCCGSLSLWKQPCFSVVIHIATNNPPLPLARPIQVRPLLPMPKWF